MNEDKTDWANLVDEKSESFIDYNRMKVHNEVSEEMNLPVITDPERFRKDVVNLKPHVLRWLEDNVDDRDDEECIKGWCIGSIKYRSSNDTIMTIFFHRETDAMKFIKEFSVNKKPVFYHNYFDDVKKILNLETGKYRSFGV